jgi:hypothetical protein
MRQHVETVYEFWEAPEVFMNLQNAPVTPFVSPPVPLPRINNAVDVELQVAAKAE